MPDTFAIPILTIMFCRKSESVLVCMLSQMQQGIADGSQIFNTT
jgi:hypothetical protein